MKISFEIPGEFPGMNEILKAAKSNRFEYAAMKRDETERVRWSISWHPIIQKPVKVLITWYSKDKRRDPDNIMAGQKFILDGIVSAKVIPNDNQKYIKGIAHEFETDVKNPRVIVEIDEINEIQEVNR